MTQTPLLIKGIIVCIVLVVIYNLFGVLESVNWNVFYFASTNLLFALISLLFYQRHKGKKEKALSIGLISYFGFMFIKELVKINSTWADLIKKGRNELHCFIAVCLLVLVLIYNLCKDE